MEKYAFVTGADHGVGFSLVTQLLGRGYFVIAGKYGKQEAELELLAKENEKLEVVPLDVGSEESVSLAANKIKEKAPWLDVVVNNAGILGDITKSLGESLDYKEMLEVYNVNALGALRVSNALLSQVLKSKQKIIVNISSEAGSIGDCYRDGWFAYCMSKAASNMQSALVHNHLKNYGGKVIVIHPGHVGTYMRGTLDITAKITPEESAVGILSVVLDREWEVTQHPLYLDYEGKELQW